jgi:hypothetical protein
MRTAKDRAADSAAATHFGYATHFGMNASV